MKFPSHLLVIIYVCLVSKQLSSAPLSAPDNFCNENTLLKYKIGNEYLYDYITNTSLEINGVSKESNSNVELKAKVIIRSVSKCLYLLRIENASLVGATIDQKLVNNHLAYLEAKDVQFRMNSDGEIHSTVEFAEADQPWSRNIKRGILSALQAKSISELRSIEGATKKSAVVYETDILGRCRTTYSTSNGQGDAEITLKKKKSLQRCTLNENSKTSAVQYVPYKNIPEFDQGKLFIEEYECKTIVKKNLIDSVECNEESTYRIGSRDKKGIQAEVKQTLKLTNLRVGSDRRVVGPFEPLEINFEYTDKSVDDMEFKNFNVENFLADICKKADAKTGLDFEHSNNYRSLVNKIESYTTDNLLKLHAEAKGNCTLAGTTVANALVFANTENSFEAVAKLMDKDEFASNQYITEFPLLTALARNQNPSLAFLKKIKTYVASKDAKFTYLRKLILIYSSLIKSHCSNNECAKATLEDLSSVLIPNLGSDCSDAKNKDLVATTLKAIGNIGHIKDSSLLVKCAKNAKNTMEVRVSAVQAFRRFSCDKIVAKDGIQDIIKDTNGDAELRISTFQIMIQCTETEEYKVFTQKYLPTFLENEKDIQVLTYIIDYAKEHGITSILNAVLSNPSLKDKFSVNFKSVSWNNYKFRYSILREGAIEVETSVIFDTKKAFIPRAIRLNVTTHLFGMSVNFLDLTIRLEGVDEIAKLSLLNKLKSEALVKKFLENPEKIAEILQMVASKLQYTTEKPYFSILVRIYGSDVYFSEIDDASELKKLAEIFRSPRDKLLYTKVQALRNMFLIDSRVRQPLLNGFEFNSFMDSSFSLLLSKDSSKQDSADGRTYKLNNFYSGSLSINRRFEIQLNKNNKLSLKKKAIANARLYLNVDGEKRNGTKSYTVNLSPNKETNLLTIDGKFYKLTSPSAYSEVTKFEVEEYVKDKCTSDKFIGNVGVGLCLSIKRPNVGSLLNFLKPETNFDEDGDDDDEEEDDDDEDDKQKSTDSKPRLSMAGPYHYEIKLKNPELLKALIYKREMKKDHESTSYIAKLQTKSASNAVKDRFDLIYSRNRNDTNLRLERQMKLELIKSNTNDVRLKVLGELRYVKKQLIHVHFDLDNKILRDVRGYLDFTRKKAEGDRIPTYKLEAGYDSKLVDNKHRKLAINLKPTGQDINGDLVVEFSDKSTNFQLKKLAEGTLKLTANKESTDIDYKVDFKLDTIRPSKLHVYGKSAFNELVSNTDLSVKYENPRFTLSEPANIVLGHNFDFSEPSARSFVNLKLKVPHEKLKINHQVKVIFGADAVAQKMNYLEFQVWTPKSYAENQGLPFSVYAGKQVTTGADSSSTEYSLGINNFKLNLTDYASRSSLGKKLVQVDNSNTLKSFGITVKRTKDSKVKSSTTKVTIKKNDALLASIDASRMGSMSAIRNTPTEIPKQELGASLSLKIPTDSALSGLIEAKVKLENSARRGLHSYAFEFKTESIFKLLFKIASIKSSIDIDSNSNKVTAEYEVVKNAEIKSMKIKTTNGQLRRSINNLKEFDVSYVKTLADGKTKTATGVVKYVFEDLKNFESTLDIDGHFSYNMSVSNERTSPDALIGMHDLYLKYVNKDVFADEREFKILLSNKTEKQLNNIIINVEARRGSVGNLKNRANLTYLIDIKLDNTFLTTLESGRNIYKGTNNVDIKSKMFNVDLTLKNKLDLDLKKAQTFTASVEHNIKFPALVSDKGKINTIDGSYTRVHDLKTQKRTIKYTMNTDNLLLGKYAKTLDLDYTREPSDAKTAITLNADLTSVQSSEKKNINLKFERKKCLDADKKQCAGTKVSLKQTVVPQYQSKLGQKALLDLTECAWESGFERQKDTQNGFDLGVKAALTCKNKELINNAIHLKLDTVEHEFKAKLAAGSDVYYEKRLYQVAYKRPTKKSGLFQLDIKKGTSIDFSESLSYERETNATTDKLIKGNYKWSMSFGEKAMKSCEMVIESKNNYYNKITCSLKTPRTPVTLNYGLSVLVNNQQEWKYGKRDLAIDANLPTGRQLRLTYVSSRHTPIEAVDLNEDNDDDEENNEREFDSTITYYWNFSKDKSDYLTVKAKRENYEKTSTRLSFDILNFPNLKTLRVELDRKRLFNQTAINLAALYETTSPSAKNRLDVTAIMSSDLDTNTISIEANMQRPKFNVLYYKKFNQNNGRLDLLKVRLAKLVQLTIDKESDPENRKIRVELVQPEKDYSVESKETNQNGVLSVVSNLKKSGSQLSTLESKFDSNNNNLNVLINGKYRLDLGIYSEKIATAEWTNVQDKSKLAVAKVKVDSDDGLNNLQIELKWNRFWSDIQKDILKAKDGRASEKSQYNSYLGDVYGTLVEDLKPSVDAMKADRKQAREDVKNLVLLNLDFYSNLVPASTLQKLKTKLEEYRGKDQVDLDSLPLHKRLARRYNRVAKALNKLYSHMKKKSSRLAKYLPRLTTISYNDNTTASYDATYDNNVVLTRPVYYSKNLYQLNAENRDRMRVLAQRVASVKGNLLRNMKTYSIRGLINKYKLRRLDSYTMVGQVYNRRNIITFAGDSKILKTKCSYLLAHDLLKNRFSVILNFNSQESIISIYGYSQGPIELSAEAAWVNGKKVALPYKYESKEKAVEVNVKKLHNGVSFELNNDLLVNCYSDSKSCIIGLTRFSTGKVAGLLGRSNYDLEDQAEEAWYLEKSCKPSPSNLQLREPLVDTQKACYSVFGKHRRSPFKNAMEAVRPNAWHKLCETILSFDTKAKCPLMKSYVQYAAIKSVDVDEPNECYQCNANEKKFNVGQTGASVESGADIALVFMPCDHQKTFSDVVASMQAGQGKMPSNKYYFIKVDNEGASIYQPESSSQKDVKKAISQMSESKMIDGVKKDHFYEGLFLAASLFTQRQARVRHIAIVSCGNCLPYSTLSTLKVVKLLKERNIKVSAWGDYDLVDNEGTLDDQTAIGYGGSANKIFLSENSNQQVSLDSLSSYVLEHDRDFCTSLATKTNGFVFNMKHLKKPKVFDEVMKQVTQLARDAATEAPQMSTEKCERLRSPFGDLADFSYKSSK